jgi:hypothetical protein
VSASGSQPWKRARRVLRSCRVRYRYGVVFEAKKMAAPNSGTANQIFSSQKVNVPCNCISRGEASAPRNEPKMLVGEATGLMIWPKVDDATSASG